MKNMLSAHRGITVDKPKGESSKGQSEDQHFAGMNRRRHSHGLLMNHVVGCTQGPQGLKPDGAVQKYAKNNEKSAQ